MKVVALKRGDKAPTGADRVIIFRDDDGFRVKGAMAASQGSVALSPPTESFTSKSDALNAAIAWASYSGCGTIYVELPPT